jgi:hypothetical protein
MIIKLRKIVERATNKLGRIFLIGFLICFFVGWSFYPALKIVWVVRDSKCTQVSKSIKNDLPELESHLIRRVQKHFLKYGFYIPAEDIVINNKNIILDRDYVANLKKSCDQGRLYIWIPLRFKIPLFGEKVLEWCFVQS